jgi:hypothetical protein
MTKLQGDGTPLVDIKMKEAKILVLRYPFC